MDPADSFPSRTETSSRRAALGTCSGAHFIHDGFSDVLYLLLPVWQAEFALTLTQVGIIKTLYSGSMAAFQVPMGMLAERMGERGLLALGTILTGAGFLVLGLAGGFASLAAFLVLAGAASSVQHPLSSALVSKAFRTGGMRAALGIYNFAGDLGKTAVPALIALIIVVIGWRWSAAGYGAIGMVFGVAVYFVLVRLKLGAKPAALPAGDTGATKETTKGKITGWGIRHVRGFTLLSAIGVIDGAGRYGFLTFVPFLLIGKGAGVETVGFALALVFAGGAVGKFVCGLLAEKMGIIRSVILTELMTGLGIFLLLPLPLGVTLWLLPLIGIGLNGTSSVLYGSVSDFVTEEKRSRGFGLFYTMTIGGGSIAPFVFGMVSDMAGVTVTLSIIAVFVLMAIPLALALNGPLKQATAEGI